MKNLTWQNPEQLFVAQVLINKVKSKCCGIKDIIENSKRIIIFGHSIYGIDYEYYADFLEKNKDTEVVVLYHNEDGKKEFENEMENRGVTRKINYEYIVISNHFFEFCENIAKDQRLFLRRNVKRRADRMILR